MYKRQAKIVRINKTFGFAQRQSDGAQIFLPGRYTLGALEGDQVLLKPISQWGDSEEGQVYAVTKPGPSTFSGSLVKQNGKFYVLPDHLTNDPVPIQKDSIGSAQVGDCLLYTSRCV